MLKNPLSFHLSGGPTNDLTEKSLGGPMSNFKLNDGSDGLFNDVTRAMAIHGDVDYRCLYVTNSSKQKFKSASFYIQKGLDGVDVDLGMSISDGIQALVVRGSPARGHFQLVYEFQRSEMYSRKPTRVVNWVPDVDVMTQRIQAILNSLALLFKAECIGHKTDTGYDFIIRFRDGRSHGALGVINKVGIDIVPHMLNPGGPISTAAPEIGIANNPPSGVTFLPTDSDQPAFAGTLYPGDVIPIWLRRTIYPNTFPEKTDRFRLHVLGNFKTTIPGQMPD